MRPETLTSPTNLKLALHRTRQSWKIPYGSPYRLHYMRRAGLHLHRTLVRYAVGAADGVATADSKPQIIYYQRGERKNRNVKGEKKLIEALRGRFGEALIVVKGPEAHHFAEMGTASLLEVATVYSRATAVISAHGPGLNHMLYCEPGTAIFMLASYDALSAEFHTSATPPGAAPPPLKAARAGKKDLLASTDGYYAYTAAALGLTLRVLPQAKAHPLGNWSLPPYLASQVAQAVEKELVKIGRWKSPPLRPGHRRGGGDAPSAPSRAADEASDAPSRPSHWLPTFLLPFTTTPPPPPAAPPPRPTLPPPKPPTSSPPPPPPPPPTILPPPSCTSCANPLASTKLSTKLSSAAPDSLTAGGRAFAGLSALEKPFGRGFRLVLPTSLGDSLSDAALGGAHGGALGGLPDSLGGGTPLKSGNGLDETLGAAGLGGTGLGGTGLGGTGLGGTGLGAASLAGAADLASELGYLSAASSLYEAATATELAADDEKPPSTLSMPEPPPAPPQPRPPRVAPPSKAAAPPSPSSAASGGGAGGCTGLVGADGESCAAGEADATQTCTAGDSTCGGEVSSESPAAPDGPDLVEFARWCGAWATLGECESNAAFMHAACAASCRSAKRLPTTLQALLNQTSEYAALPLSPAALEALSALTADGSAELLDFAKAVFEAAKAEGKAAGRAAGTSTDATVGTLGTVPESGEPPTWVATAGGLSDLTHGTRLELSTSRPAVLEEAHQQAEEAGGVPSSPPLVAPLPPPAEPTSPARSAPSATLEEALQLIEQLRPVHARLTRNERLVLHKRMREDLGLHF